MKIINTGASWATRAAVSRGSRDVREHGSIRAAGQHRARTAAAAAERRRQAMLERMRGPMYARRGESEWLMGQRMMNPYMNPFTGMGGGMPGFGGFGGGFTRPSPRGNLSNDFGFTLPSWAGGQSKLTPQGSIGGFPPADIPGRPYAPGEAHMYPGSLVPQGASNVHVMTKMGGPASGYRASSAHDTMTIPNMDGVPSYGAGRTAGNLGVGWMALRGGMGAGPLGALAGAALAIGLDKEGYYASGGLHDAIDNTLGRIPVIGGILDFATDAVQGVLDVVGLGGIFGGNREAKAAKEKYQKERQITWKHMQIANNRRWTDNDSDTNKVRRDQTIQDWFLNSQQSLDGQRWNEEDAINDASFIQSLGFNNASFALDNWKFNTLGQLGDQKMWTDTNIANNFANARTAQNINIMMQRAGLEAETAIAANAISTNLIQRIGTIQDNVSDKKGALAKFAYEENQRIEDDLYAASVQLDKVGAKRDMERVLTGWDTKTKMEERANEKLFRGDQIQKERFEAKVAQQQHKAKLMMSAGSRGTAEQADPIRAQRISMLSKLNGVQSMAAERLGKLTQIGSSLDFVRDSVEQDPENWNQSKKQLQFMLDSLDDI